MFFFDEQNDNLVVKPKSIAHAYLAILSDDLEVANAIFSELDSPRAIWGRALCSILIGYIEKYPTYFEIRNFLEIDLDFLLKNEKIDYVEQLLGSLELLSNINQESYKYVARVMFENKLFKSAKEYLDRSRQLFYNDPELHFIYAKYYIHERDYINANKHIDICLNILNDYFPAKKLKHDLSRYLAKS